MTQYCWSADGGEGFNGRFNTPEEAVADAVKTFGLEPGTLVEVGEIFEPTVRQFVEGAVDLSVIFECIGENAYEFGGEAAEDWPEFPDWSEQKRTPGERALQKKIIDLVVAYLEEHDPPRFWGVENIVKMKVPGTSE